MWPFSSLIRETALEAEQRSAIDFSAFSDLLNPAYSGVTVNEGTAVQLPAVFKCVSLNAESIASLPLDIYAKRGETRVSYPEPVWLRPPNALQTLREFIAMTQTSLDLDGNAFWVKISDAQGRLSGLEVVSPLGVGVELVGGIGVIYRVQRSDGTQSTLAPTEVVHLRGLTLPGNLRGLSPIECAKQTIGTGKAAEQFGAQFFGNGATMSGVVETPGSLTEEQAERIKASMTKRHGGISNSHAIGILSGGASWKQLSVKPEEAQFLQTRKFTNDEVSQMFGYPAGFFDADGAKGYVTALSRVLRLWYITGLMPRLTRIEEALSGLLPRGVYAKFNRNALLQMDPAERTAYYQAAQLGEWMTRNEIRALEEMNPMEDGDEPLHSVQWQENAPEALEDVPDDEPDDEPAPDGPSDGGTQ